jgi:uncharacterized protein (TIGR03000 family)
MVRRWFSIAGLLALAVVMMAADASQAGPLQRLRARLRGDDNSDSSPRFSLRRSYYRGEQVASVSPSQIALDIRVPSSAEVFVGGEKISGTGTMRRFTSDNLTAGQTYEYKVKGKWTENGKEVTRERTVKAMPGERTTVDLMQSTEKKKPVQGESLKQPKESE